MRQVLKARYKTSNPMVVDVCAAGCESTLLDATLKGLNADGWYVRQIFQEAERGDYYRIFCQREKPLNTEAPK